MHHGDTMVASRTREGVPVQHIALLDWKSGITQEQQDGALARRAGWQYPDGIKVIAEFWPMSPRPAVVSIFDTDDISKIMQIMFAWSDVFDITVLPGVTAEEGLRIGPSVMAAARG
jgi:hypothetical protein